MEKTVKRFLDVILDQATPLIATLNKGVDKSQIAEFEAEMGIKTIISKFQRTKRR